jgi:pimeloyl-ACP methyl ester carboxylesterase
MPDRERVSIDGDSGHKLHVREWGGDGPPLLLLHGLGGHTHWWDPVVPALLGSFRVFAMDLRGHGESGWCEPPRYSVRNYTWDIEHVRRHYGWNSFLLAGHSLGARVCVHYSVGHEGRVERLMLLDFLAASRDGIHAKYERKMKRRQPTYADRDLMIRRFKLQPAGTRAPRDMLDSVAENSVRRLENGRWTWKFDWRAFYMEYPPIWEELEQVEAPTLVVRGEKSAVMPRSAYDGVLDRLPNSVGVEIPGAYHHVTLDAPMAVARHLLEFSLPPLSSGGAPPPHNGF